MARAQVTAITCKSALNRVSGMPFRWSLNPYRGCAHGCHYCYARATHPYLGLDAGADFSTRLYAKVNVAETLRRELARPGWSGELVAIGTATDAYQPIEGRFRLTRQCLEVFLDARNPIGIVTKSTLVLRDLDLLAELAQVARVKVHLTITTLERDLWRVMEPGTPPPAQRLLAVRRLVEAGVPAGVLMAPVMPGLNDSEGAIEAVAAAAAAHGAVSFSTAPLRLAPLVKEHYLGVLGRVFPPLLPRYERAYVGANAPRSYLETVEVRTARVRARITFPKEAEHRQLAAASRSERQLPLPL